jgi:hypothetical protein
MHFQYEKKYNKRNTDLWCKVEAQVAATREVVLNQERHLTGEADLDLSGQGSSLAEVDQILERKGQGHGLRQLNVDIQLGLVDVGVASQSDGAVTNVTVARELDAVLGSLNADCQ